MALLVFFIAVNRAGSASPLPFILISILSDKPGHTPAPLVPLHPRHIQPTLPRTPARRQQSSFVCSRRKTPPPHLPPRPDLDDVGWRGWRHASTGTPGQRKGRGRVNEGGVGGWMVGFKKKGLALIFLSLFLLCFTFLYFFCPFRITWVGVLSRVCGEGRVDYTLNPPPPVQTKLKEEKPLAENYFWPERGSQDGAEKNGL